MSDEKSLCLLNFKMYFLCVLGISAVKRILRWEKILCRGGYSVVAVWLCLGLRFRQLPTDGDPWAFRGDVAGRVRTETRRGKPRAERIGYAELNGFHPRLSAFIRG
jgi:hypothetical protein